MRMIVAGLSSRISYRSIDTYASFVNNLNSYTYDEIKAMSDNELLKIIERLGLFNSRIKFIRSMIKFIDKYENRINEFDNDKLIGLIQSEVDGAAYKLAQCCTLYARGYNCGVMPVDSGMKDKLLPCIGFENFKTAIGHEKLRKQLEHLTSKSDCREIAVKNRYGQLNLPSENKPLTWWVHLVLIYYKREYCNKKKPELCLLNNCDEIGCSKTCV